VANESVAESNPAPRKPRDPEFWIAIGALAVSALAMASSVMQVSLQRNQERALVWPHVSSSSAYSSKGYSYVAANKGLGPALVRHVELSVDGRVVKNWREVLDTVLGPDHGYSWDQVQGNDLEDTILAADTRLVMFGIPWDERVRAGFGGAQRISARICYCSFLGECWISRAGLDHERVEQCPAATP
jgi:hypothetical protein